MNKIDNLLKKYDLSSLKNCEKICLNNNIDVENIVRQIQPYAFDNAVDAFTLGCAICLISKQNNAIECAKLIGEALESFTVCGSVAENRHLGIGHGNLAAKLLDEKTNCFCFLAGHESFAASEGAVAIAQNVNKSRKTPLKIILNGLGKDAAYIISRIMGFTYVETNYDYKTDKLSVVKEKSFSENPTRKSVRVYGAYDANEGLAIMKYENVDVSITGNSTNPTRFQHPVAGMYKNWCYKNNKEFFSVASGGGTGRTLHPDNNGAGPASYGLTDLMGKMHADAQFAGSSSVPAHVNMMGFVGMGNNPLLGATLALAVICSNTQTKK